MQTPEQWLGLLELDPHMKLALTEVALLVKDIEPTMLTEYLAYESLSSSTRAFIDSYPVEAGESPLYNFFEDLYDWEVLDHRPYIDINRPTYVGSAGELLIKALFDDELSLPS
mgnify:CR=1 FL=1